MMEMVTCKLQQACWGHTLCRYMHIPSTAKKGFLGSLSGLFRVSNQHFQGITHPSILRIIIWPHEPDDL